MKELCLNDLLNLVEIYNPEGKEKVKKAYECAKLIVQSGIKEVIYSCDKYASLDNTIASKIIFKQCNIKYRQIELEEKKSKTLTKC